MFPPIYTRLGASGAQINPLGRLEVTWITLRLCTLIRSFTKSAADRRAG